MIFVALVRGLGLPVLLIDGLTGVASLRVQGMPVLAKRIEEPDRRYVWRGSVTP